VNIVPAARLVIPSPAWRALRRLAIFCSPYPRQAWGTKGFQFWTFLSLLLANSNCSRLLELGSGRSTITMAEYAKFRNGRFICLETNRKWFNKARMELRCLAMADDPIHFVNWDAETWYSIEEFRSIVQDAGGFDFAFIDGPNRNDGSSDGIRDSEVALREILNCTRGADVVVIDDVHRRHILSSVDRMLVDPSLYEKLYYDYVVKQEYPNTICICVKKLSRAHAHLGRIQEMMDMRFYTTLNPESCPED